MINNKDSSIYEVKYKAGKEILKKFYIADSLLEVSRLFSIFFKGVDVISIIKCQECTIINHYEVKIDESIS